MATCSSCNQDLTTVEVYSSTKKCYGCFSSPYEQKSTGIPYLSPVDWAGIVRDYPGDLNNVGKGVGAPYVVRCQSCGGLSIVHTGDCSLQCSQCAGYRVETFSEPYSRLQIPGNGTAPGPWAGCNVSWWLDGAQPYKAPTRCRIHPIQKDLPLPAQANPGDAGWDVVAAETVIFTPGETRLVPLGIIAEAPLGYHFKLFIRSSLAKARWSLANAVGIIDSTFCGPEDEIKALMRAPSAFSDVKTHTIARGQRVCQLILEKNNQITWDVQLDRDFAGKSRGGFGSSGK